MDSARLTAEEILAHVRAMIVVVDGEGAILDVRGGAGGFLGWRTADLRNQNVLDFVVDDEVEEVASYFTWVSADRVRTVPMPMPFRVLLRGADGTAHEVDVIPTGCVEDGETWGWVVLLVPLVLQSSASRSLNAELAGRPRTEVRQRLTEELAYDNSWGRLVWYFVDLSHPEIGPTLTAPRDEPDVAGAFGAALSEGWEPWTSEPDGFASDLPSTTYFAREMPPHDLPGALYVKLRSAGWTRLFSVPVDLDGEIVGVYLALGRIPAADDRVVRTNSDQRISSLLDVTRLLIGRWRTQDRLVLAATSDSLTGVANREAFNDAIATVEDPYAVLYVDVDSFKEINDRWGHAVGDQVLIDVARRIERSCDPDDLVARFGGDEFVVLLRDIDADTARRVGERIIAASSERLRDGVGPERVTLSVGLAVGGGAGAADAVDAADRAMLIAKREGRNRLVIG